MSERLSAMDRGGVDTLVTPTVTSTSKSHTVFVAEPSCDLPPQASPVFRKGWLAGVRYVLEALEAGTDLAEVNIVVDVVAAEAKPKPRGFSRKRR